MTPRGLLIAWRRSWSVRHLPVWYAEAENMYRSVLGQRTALGRLKDGGLDTVVFGSSHAHKGYWAEGRDFNLANSHVDLSTSVALFRILCESGVRMRRALLYYDVFSSGFEMQRTASWFKAVPYEMLFGISFVAPKPREYWRLAWCLGHLPEDDRPADPNGNNGFDWFFPPETDVAARVASHVKNHRRSGGQDAQVDEFAGLARRHGVAPAVVAPPLRADYLRELDGYGEDVFGGVRRLCERSTDVPFLDFTRNGAFSDGDFGDLDHLNRRGAEKLTKLVKTTLEGGSHV